MPQPSFLLAAFLLVACMQTETSDAPDGVAGGSVQDQNLLAGASSTTNWPLEDAGRAPTRIIGYSDSALVLKSVDIDGAPVNMAGRLTLYKAGAIPAFDAPESTAMEFPAGDSIVVPDSLIDGINKQGRDSVAFSVLIKFDTSESFITGFVYSTKLKKYLASPFSADPNTSPPVSNRHYYIHGEPDASLANMGFSSGGKTEWCFYIPGSPFFFTASPDTGSSIDIGPIPRGKYPLRLVRIAKADGQTIQDQLEVYEVVVKNSEINAAHPRSYKIITAGNRIFTSPLSVSLSIRSDRP